MKPDVWMPCMVKDLLADTLALDNAQFGSYWLLICAYWMNRGPIPDDDSALRQICRCREAEWARTKGVMVRFFDAADGQWRHKKVDSLLSEAIQNMKDQRQRTEAARQARLIKDSVTTSVTDNVTEPVTTPVTASPSPSPSPSPLTAPASTTKDVGAIKSRPTSECDADWVKTLSADTAYQGIDVNRELGRMTHWCTNNRKQATRRRFINWLNRCERPLEAAGKPKNCL
jgi:uncharacterized protein YdaU (DUF1376 family)